MGRFTGCLKAVQTVFDLIEQAWEGQARQALNRPISVKRLKGDLSRAVELVNCSCQAYHGVLS